MFLGSKTGGDPWGMAEPLATALHAVQDFYGHTNWVELGKGVLGELGFAGNDWGGVGLSPPDEATCRDCPEGECFVDGLVNLTSGYFKDGEKPNGESAMFTIPSSRADGRFPVSFRHSLRYLSAALLI